MRSEVRFMTRRRRSCEKCDDTQERPRRLAAHRVRSELSQELHGGDAEHLRLRRREVAVLHEVPERRLDLGEHQEGREAREDGARGGLELGGGLLEARGEVLQHGDEAVRLSRLDPRAHVDQERVLVGRERLGRRRGLDDEARSTVAVRLQERLQRARVVRLTEPAPQGLPLALKVRAAARRGLPLGRGDRSLAKVSGAQQPRRAPV